jgi:iron complex outermembrane receptor protein
MALLMRLFFVLGYIFSSATTYAVTTEEEEFAKLYGDEEFISLATGSHQAVNRAPAVASVITAADIKAMVVTDLDQLLEAIPGVHVSYTPTFNPVYIVRGIRSEFNPQVLMLINGIPITHLFLGNRGQAWGGMPVNNIARIEIIRGPGSALFGADAFAGTINIVTKTFSDINGMEIGARAGSFNSREAWLLKGGQWRDIKAAFSVEWRTTEGHRGIVDTDAQVFFDGLFGTSASLAPGPVNAGRDALETRLDFSRDAWRLRLGYQGRRNVGSGAGSAQALDPQGYGDSDRFNADLTYDKPDFSPDWELTAQLSYFDVNTKYALTLYPPGVTFPTGTFPQGMIGIPSVYERHIRFSAATVYTGFANHRIRLGIGANDGNMYKVQESKNFVVGSGGLPVPLGSVIDVSDDPARVYIRPHQRTVIYALAQDEWSFAPDWNLTAGVRHDAYSDFGGTTNPRLALVWQSSFTLTSKLLYGRAFRAPAFAELYNINNPLALGSPNLKPETIDTVELAFDYRPSDTLRSNFNLFRYEMSDIIRFVSDPAPATSKTARNQGMQDGYGLEWEMRWNVTRAVDLKANYAWQHSTDETGKNVANVPRHKLYAQADWRFLPYWSVNTQINRVMGRERTAGDNRPAIADYTVVNLALRRKNVLDGFDVGLIVHNALDSDVREPSPAPGYIRDDLPMPGRGVYVELRYAM